MFTVKTLAVLLAASLVSAEVLEDVKKNKTQSVAASAVGVQSAVIVGTAAGVLGAATAPAAPGDATVSIAITIPAAAPTAGATYGGEDDGGDDDDDQDEDNWSGNITSTIYTTTVYTITSCASTVPSCPAKIGQVTTEVITSTTVICPATVSASPTAPPAPPSPPSYPTSAQSQVVYPTTTPCLTTSYGIGNTTYPTKPTSAQHTYPTFAGGAQKVGGSLSLVAAIAFIVAAL